MPAKIMDATYVDVLYCILHPIGRSSNGFMIDQQTMFDSVKKAFKKSKSEHSKLMSSAQKLHDPRIVLRVTVIEAKGLKAKDVIGTSDPYCVLGIHTEPDPKSPKKTARELITSTNQGRTRLLYQELNPVWNELFQFEISNVNKDCFLLDIWDNDTEQTFSETVYNLGQNPNAEAFERGMKDVTKVLKSGEELNDFLGRMSCMVKAIPSTGERAWYALEGRSSKSNVQGLVRIGFRLAVIKPGIPIDIGRIREVPIDDTCQERINKNVQVIKVFIKHTVSGDYPSENDQWVGSIANELAAVIHLHALHNDLNEFQEDLSLWIAYVEEHHFKNLRYSAMLFYLERLHLTWSQNDRNHLHCKETALLQRAFQIFIGDCLENIRCFRNMVKDSQNFNNLLKCLETLMKSNLVQMCNHDWQLKENIEIFLKKGTNEWYKKTFKKVEPITKQPKDVIQSLLNHTLNINGELVKGNASYSSKFQMLGIDYEHLVYPLIEKNLVGDITGVLNVVGDGDRVIFSEIIKFRKNWENDEELWKIYFKLYIALKELSLFLDKLPAGDRHSPNLSEYHEWFRFHLERWMVMSHEKSLAIIRKSIAIDEAVKLTDLTTFSSSAVDVGVCLNELSEMVSQLAWPNGCEWYAIGTLVLAMISDGAKLYAKLIHDKLQAVKFFDELGQFDVSDQLYRIINSIEQVRLSLAPQFQKLESLRPPSETLIDTNDMERITFLSDARDRMFKEANSTILRIIQNVLTAVAEQMRGDLKNKMNKVSSTHLDEEERENAFRDLDVYLEQNLALLYTNLMVNNFDIFLLTLWTILLDILMEIIKKNTRKEMAYFEWMGEVLERLEAIIHADGNGLPRNVMENEEYLETKKEILLRGELAPLEGERSGKVFPCLS